MIFFSFVSVFLVYSECLTPNEKPGTCLELTTCSTLYNLMLMRGKEPAIANYLRKSQCGLTHDKTPKVCCPPSEHQGSQNTATRVSPVPFYPQPSHSNGNSNAIECGKTIREFKEKIVGGMNASLGTVYVL